jgi:hypothetical protein
MISDFARLSDDEVEEELPEATRPQRSFLVADCGNANTSVTLFDIVDGQFRFIASGVSLTTAGPPWYDFSRGLRQAIARISEATGRVLLHEGGSIIRPSRSDGAGVDVFGAVASLADPVRVLLIGLMEDVSLASARRALGSVYTEEVDCFGLADGRSQQEQVQAIIEQEIDFVLVVGGTDSGADKKLIRLVETLSLGLIMLDESQRPAVIFAGNRALRTTVAEVLDDLTDVFFANNVRPSHDRENLAQLVSLLDRAYLDEKVTKVPGMEMVANWSSYNLVSTARALGDICEYLGVDCGGRILCLDVGSNSVTLAAANKNEVQLTVRSDLGIGRPVKNVVNIAGREGILGWTAGEGSVIELDDLSLNKSLLPQSMPLDGDEVLLEQALLREIIRQVLDESTERWVKDNGGAYTSIRQLLLRGGALVNVARLGPMLLAVLDGLQPTGIFPVSLDRLGILPALGLLAAQNAQLAVQVLNSGALEALGWVIAPDGQAKMGQTAIRAKLEADGAQAMQVDVAGGSLEVIPLPPGDTAKLTLQPASMLDIGVGAGKTRKIEVWGGTVGLVIDARGRPLKLPKDVVTRKSQVQQWFRDVGG